MGNPPDPVLITVDVEDWFQVENFKPWIPYSSWSHHRLRVEQNTHLLLDLFDGLAQNRGAPVQATFFILGWIARRLPRLVREISARGHEVASHGVHHELCTQMRWEELARDLRQSKSDIENILSSPVGGFRAPSFAINDRILDLVATCGYRYDSSFNSFALHGRYGRLTHRGAPRGIGWQGDNGLIELPVSNLTLGRAVVPWGGGGYFRIIPLALFLKGIKWIIARQRGYLFYMHPWELDPGQPKVAKASPAFKFRHYTNLGATATKLKRLIQALPGCVFITCHQYLDRIGADEPAQGRD